MRYKGSSGHNIGNASLDGFFGDDHLQVAEHRRIVRVRGDLLAVNTHNLVGFGSEGFHLFLGEQGRVQGLLRVIAGIDGRQAVYSAVKGEGKLVAHAHVIVVAAGAGVGIRRVGGQVFRNHAYLGAGSVLFCCDGSAVFHGDPFFEKGLQQHVVIGGNGGKGVAGKQGAVPGIGEEKLSLLRGEKVIRIGVVELLQPGILGRGRGGGGGVAVLSEGDHGGCPGIKIGIGHVLL